MKNNIRIFHPHNILNMYIEKRKLKLLFCVFLSFISTFSTLLSAYLVKYIINTYIVPHNFQGLINALVILSSVYLIGILASTLQTQLIIRISYTTISTLRQRLFSKLQKIPITYFDKNAHGNIMNIFTNDMETLQTSLEQSIIQVLNNTLQIIGTLIMIYILGGKLIIITISVTILMIIISKFLSKLSTSYFTQQQEDIGNIASIIQESLSGHETIQLFHLEEKAIKQFNKQNNLWSLSSTKAQSLSGFILPIVNYLNTINTGLTAMFGALMILNGQIDIGSLTACIQLTLSYNQPFKQISMQVNNILQGIAGGKRISSTLQLDSEYDYGNIKFDHTHTSWINETANLPCHGNISLNNVSFGYTKNNIVLKDITLSAQQGEKIALVGSTGSGKTTIANLLNRFYEIEHGEITYDGINIQYICKDDLRRSIGVVFQDTHLFTGTIMENIKYGHPYATDDDIINIAKLTQADYFITRLPEGYSTLLIRDGENISAGLRQLISITRTAIANPPVIILDESTSSIDTRTEALVNKGLSFLMQNRTVFIIAHKFSTIRNADRIYVLDYGKIVEHGTHKDLINARGKYYQLSTGVQLS
ncbi:MAG: ABC transporter ATP-binding protein [Culicoidibacterales bacterium]